MEITSIFGNPLFQFIAGIAVLIFVHELGHFTAAKFFNVHVEEFGIGFPPRLVKLFEAGGTQFTLNWIPLGGFVRLKGDNDPSIPGGMAAASPWVRLAVLFAGPLTNIAAGIVLTIILFYQMGEPILDRVQVQYVAPQSPAAHAGLTTGDIITHVESNEIKSTEQLQAAIYDRLGTPTSLTVQRNEENISLVLTPRDPPPPDEGAIGIMMGYATQPTTWWKAIPRGSAAAFQYTRLILSLPVALFRGDVTPEQARPVGYKGMYDIYQQLNNPLTFFMMITMSLGIFNLLPIPALDGGRILLTLPEIIIHRRVPPQYENMIHMVGFSLLLLLLIYINLQDFLNPIQLPF